IKRIAVGADGSAGSRRALRCAVDLARPSGAGVVLVAAWGHPGGFEWTVRTTNYGLVPLPERTTPEEEVAAAEQTMTDIVAELGDLGGVTVTTTPVEGNATDVLIGASAQADVLVLGRHGHSTVRERLLGSVTDHCIQHGHCPVLVVPPAE